ncbi:MAG TPA: AI-2E family transporter [Blastocatellia bacterium]|nr:AI-2E family transporter [Blastocatellia bacterium]
MNPRSDNIRTQKRATVIFLLSLSAIALLLCLVIARPFLTSIGWALIIAVTFHPVHNRLQRSLRNRNAAALASVVIVILIIVIPAVLLSLATANELQNAFQSVSKKSAAQGGWGIYLTRMSDAASKWIGGYIQAPEFDLRRELLSRLELISSLAGSTLANLAGNVTSVLIQGILTLFILFFVLRDGKSARRLASAVIPLSQDQVERLFNSVTDTIIADMYGVVAVAIAQALLMAAAFWVLGLPSPFLWGAISSVVSLLPIGGTAFVWLPASLILGASGHWAKAIILFAWGAGVVGMLATIVQPIVLGRRTKLHTLQIFLGLLGGIQAFGIIGLFLGPIIISVTGALFHIIREENRVWRSGEKEVLKNPAVATPPESTESGITTQF